MIDTHQIAWMKEFLLGLAQNSGDKSEILEIVESYRKLWMVAVAARQNPHPQSPRLAEALTAIKAPDRVGKPGAGSL